MSWLRKTDLGKHYGVDPATVMRWVKEGKIPKPVRISAGVIVWPSSVIEEHDRMMIERAMAAGDDE